MIKKYIESLVRNFFSNWVQVQTSVVQRLINQSQVEGTDFIKRLFEDKNYTPLLFSSRREIQNYVVSLLKVHSENSKKLGLLEFGVFKGASLRYFSKNLKNFSCFGFDSFEGLETNFGGLNAQLLFKLNGVTPKFMPRNSTIVKGRIEDTIEDFITKNDYDIKFLHLDLDVYSSTKVVLSSLKAKLTSGTFLLFDEMFGNPFWEKGEFLALSEVFEESEFEWIGFGPNQALIVLK
jgi:hypothetical protein